MQVFLSYRLDNAGGYAGRLADTLLQRLGPRSVFQDVTSKNWPSAKPWSARIKIMRPYLL